MHLEQSKEMQLQTTYDVSNNSPDFEIKTYSCSVSLIIWREKKTVEFVWFLLLGVRKGLW